MATVKLGGGFRPRRSTKGPGLRKPVKTPKSRLRKQLRASGYTKKQSFRITSHLAAGGRTRGRQLKGLRSHGFRGATMGKARKVHHPSKMGTKTRLGGRKAY